MADLCAYGTCDSHLWESQTLKSPPKSRYFLFLPSEVEKYIDCHDSATQNLAIMIPLPRLCKHSHNVKQSTPFCRHCEALQKPKQSIYENNLAESWRSENVENAESAESSKSNLVDLQVWVSCVRNARHAKTYGKSAMTIPAQVASSIKGFAMTPLLCHCEHSLECEAIHSKNNPHEVRTNSRSASWCIKRGVKEAGVLPLFLCKKRIKARLSPKSEKAAAFLCVGERGGGAALFAKKSDYINENVSIESRRIERGESAESLKDSSDFTQSSEKMDCHDLTSSSLAMTERTAGFTSMGELRTQCTPHQAYGFSHNADSTVDSIASAHSLQTLTLTYCVTHTTKAHNAV